MTVSTPATHNTVETRFVKAGRIAFTYRRFGLTAEVPLVMLQHFRGNLDNWDPALTDAIAGEREVILVDYPGVGSSTGGPSNTIAETARQIIAFVTAFGLEQIDLLGFSIGGFVAQEIALVRPTLVRRLVLAATGPKGAPEMHGWRADIAAAARGESKPENLLYVMFAHTDTGQAKGMEFLARVLERREGRDTPTSDAACDAQFGTNRRRAKPPQLVLLGRGDEFRVTDASPGTRYLLMAGEPYGEVPVFNGPFVD